MEVNTEAQELVVKEEDYVIFYTQSESIETKLVLEVVLLETDQLHGITKPRGLGYAKLPLFYDQMPITIDLMQGGPREVIKHENDPGYEGQKTNSIITFKVR
jgi:hypothetical protein